MKDSCPLCRVKITKIREICLDKSKNCDEEGKLFQNYPIGYCKSTEYDFQFVKDKLAEEEMDLACLDHAYFHEELEKLTKLIVDVKRERFERRGAEGTDHEWNVLEQIEIQLDNLCILNDELVQFDIQQRLSEIYTMAETLFKIKTGKLEKEFVPYVDPNYEYTDFDVYNAQYDEYGDDYYQEGDEEAEEFYMYEHSVSKKGKGVKPHGRKPKA